MLVKCTAFNKKGDPLVFEKQRATADRDSIKHAIGIVCIDVLDQCRARLSLDAREVQLIIGFENET